MVRAFRFPRLLWTVLAAVLLALPATAQKAPQDPAQSGQKPAAQFGGRVNVNEVLLDVLVTDKKGNVIIGLKPSDFIVEEDGRPMDVTGVTFYSNSRFVDSAAEAKAKGIDRAPEDRYFIVFLHDQRRDSPDLINAGAQQLDAMRQTRKWVREDLLPSDWVAVASYDVKLKLHQDFTHDKGEILRALDEAARGKDPSYRDWPSREEQRPGVPQLRAHLPRGKELRDQTTTIYDGLRLLAEAARPIRGRKNLILLSRGFGDLDSFGLYKPDVRYYPAMMKALNDANVAVYSVDMTPTAVDNQMTNALSHISLDTGGQYYTEFANFISPLRDLTEENSGYYLLSYRSTHPAEESGFQEVTVKTKNPEFEVRARQGYLFGSKESGHQTESR